MQLMELDIEELPVLTEGCFCMVTKSGDEVSLTPCYLILITLTCIYCISEWIKINQTVFSHILLLELLFVQFAVPHYSYIL